MQRSGTEAGNSDEPDHSSHGRRQFDNSEEIEMLWNLLQSVSAWIRHAEAKLGALVAFAGAGLAVAVNVGMDLSQTDSVFGTIVFSLTVLAGGLSSFSAILGLLPRTIKKSSTPGNEASPIFFGDIAGAFDTPRALKNALSRVGNDGQPSFQDFIIQQIYENSIVASRKFCCAKTASFFLAGEVFLIVLAVFIFGFAIE